MKNYKNILVVINGGLPLPAVKGGAVETLIEMFLRYNELEHNYHFVVYSKYDSKAIKEAKKYKYCSFEYIPTNNIFYKIKRLYRGFIKRILKKNILPTYVYTLCQKIKAKDINYDAVIVENNVNLIIPISKLYPGKVIYHLHNDHLNNTIPDAIEIYNSCKRIFTVSNYIKNRVETINKDNRVEVLFNGIDLDKFYDLKTIKNRKIIRDNFSIKEKDLVFVFSGRINWEKGILELVQAFVNLKKKGINNIKLLIIGGSFYSSKKKTDYVKKLIKISSEYSNDIIFTGYIDYKDIGKYYCAADIQVVPSMFDDPCPLTILEGMAMGLPQIVSRCGGIPEETSSENAIFVDRDNIVSNLEIAMKILIDDKELRLKMGKISLNRSKNFSSQRFVDDFYSLIKKEL